MTAKVEKIPKNGCLLATIFRCRVTKNVTVGKLLHTMKVFIILNWRSVIGSNGNIKVSALENALHSQEA